MLTLILFFLVGKTLLGNVLVIILWLLVLKWLLGITISPSKRAEFKRRQNEFRQQTDEAWEKYKDENTHLVTSVVNTVDERGNILHTDTYSKIERPGRRIWPYLFAIALFNIVSGFAIQNMEKRSPWLAGFYVAAVAFGVFYYGRQHLLYDRWYMKLIYFVSMQWFFIYTLGVMTHKF
jgi:hypothetical protein